MSLFIAICTPVYRSLTPEFFDSYQQLWKPRVGVPHPFGVEGQCHRLMTRGMLIDDARRVSTIDGLNLGVSHYLWVDDDMQFPPYALRRLFEHRVPIVGGLCHNRRSPYQPLLGKKHPDADRGYGWCYHYPPDALFEVDVTGAGFLLIERQVIDDITKKFGFGKWWDKRAGLSEDFSFCERAKECGYRIFVDTGLDIGHVAEVVVDAAFARKNRPFEHDAWVEDPGMAEGKAVASIVIPTYNQKPAWLKTAVLSASHQTVPVEVLVVDDGSDPPVPAEGWPENVRIFRHAEKDGIIDCVDSVGDATYRSKNMGIAEALNTGIENMRTPWFCWLSSDDLLDPRKVAMQLTALQQAGAKAGFHRYQVLRGIEGEFPEIAAVPGWRNLAEQRKVLGEFCAINGSTIMVHKSVFSEVGGFDPKFRYGQDWELMARIGQKHLWYCVDEILGTRREQGNLTQAINESAASDERRQRRDAEDAEIRRLYHF